MRGHMTKRQTEGTWNHMNEIRWNETDYCTMNISILTEAWLPAIKSYTSQN